jgi:hypothetical protein
MAKIYADVRADMIDMFTRECKAREEMIRKAAIKHGRNLTDAHILKTAVLGADDAVYEAFGHRMAELNTFE